MSFRPLPGLSLVPIRQPSAEALGYFQPSAPQKRWRGHLPMAAPSSRTNNHDDPGTAYPAHLPPPSSFPRVASSPVRHAHMPSRLLAISGTPIVPTGSDGGFAATCRKSFDFLILFDSAGVFSGELTFFARPAEISIPASSYE